MSFFDNSLVVTQLDRRSYTTDFIQYTNGCQVWNPEHIDLIQPLMDKYGYKPSSGTATDVGGLRRRGLKVSSHNLSCGYFNEHGDSEVASVALMINAFSFAYEMLTMLAERNIPLEFPLPSFDLPKNANMRSYSSESHLGLGAKQISIWDDDDDDLEWCSFLKKWVKKDEIVKKDDPFSWQSETDSSDKQSTKTVKSVIKSVIEEEIDEFEQSEMYNEWIMSVYPEYAEIEERNQLTHLSMYYKAGEITELGRNFELDSSVYSQDLIDEFILDGICPVCSGHVCQTNELLIETICTDCESVFNITPDMVAEYQDNFKEVYLGQRDFSDIQGKSYGFY